MHNIAKQQRKKIKKGITEKILKAKATEKTKTKEINKQNTRKQMNTYVHSIG